ncbi:MAG: hypothetical protein ITG00_04535 [Flavobacterium sp.]|nr:hypothetical protein [Flavobacterium sp.]
MQDWTELYKELAEKIKSNVKGVKWIDLWNSQVYNLEGEHPFPAPAVFLAFRSNRMDDAGLKVQKVELQVDVFLFYETFLDTYHGAYNQEQALEFLETLSQLNRIFHGSDGKSYSSMRRLSFSPVDTGGAGNLYSVTYSCQLMDYSAADEIEEGTFSDLTIEPKEVFIVET